MAFLIECVNVTCSHVLMPTTCFISFFVVSNITADSVSIYRASSALFSPFLTYSLARSQLWIWWQNKNSSWVSEWVSMALIAVVFYCTAVTVNATTAADAVVVAFLRYSFHHSVYWSCSLSLKLQYFHLFLVICLCLSLRLERQSVMMMTMFTFISASLLTFWVEVRFELYIFQNNNEKTACCALRIFAVEYVGHMHACILDVCCILIFNLAAWMSASLECENVKRDKNAWRI